MTLEWGSLLAQVVKVVKVVKVILVKMYFGEGHFLVILRNILIFLNIRLY